MRVELFAGLMAPPALEIEGAVSEFVLWCEDVSREDWGDADRDKCLMAPSRSLEILFKSVLSMSLSWVTSFS